MASSQPLRKRELLGYGILAMPLAFAGMPLYIHAPDYYAAQFGVSLSQIGIALLVLRLIDAFQDPLIGRLSDRFAPRRYAIMLVCAFILVAGFAALFQPLIDAVLLWFALMMLAATTAFSVLSVNLNTLGGLWRDDAHQKTRITAWRESFGLIGLLIAVLLPSILQQSMDAPLAFIWVSVVLAGCMLLAFAWFGRWHRHHSVTLQHQPNGSLWQASKALPRSTRRFFSIYGLSMLASAMPAVLILFFVRDRLEAEALTGLFLVLYFMAGALGMPLWQWLSRRHGKAQAWAMAMGLAVISFVWAFFLGAGDHWQFAVICVASGIAFGADLALPPSMLADHIHHHDQTASAALQFSILTFLAKSALALASALVFPLLDAVGFVAGGVNTSQALLGLSAAYALIPCLIKLAAACWLWRSLSYLKQGDYDENTHPDRSYAHAK